LPLANDVVIVLFQRAAGMIVGRRNFRRRAADVFGFLCGSIPLFCSVCQPLTARLSLRSNLAGL
jgi:hypothetical protein